MDIIPVLDILNNQAVKAIKGNRNSYQPINKQLYNTTDPRDIICLIVKKFKPNIIYIADLNAIIDNNVNHKLIEFVLRKFPKIQFWVDSGLNKIKLSKNFQNYVPVFCGEKSMGFELLSKKYKNYICSLDFKENFLGSKPVYKHIRHMPKKIIIMDLMQVGSDNKFNLKIANKFIKNNKKDYYIAGGIKKVLDIKKAKQIGAKGVLVSSILHQNKLTKIFIQKEKTSL